MKSINAIEVRNMSKYFKINFDKPKTLKEKLLFFNRGTTEVHQVLNDINIDIKKGENIALIGSNGSGKSTLLKLMSKIIYPSSGHVDICGKVTSLLELGAGFHPDFTGRENIYFNASIFGLTHKEIDNKINTIIEFSELGEFIDEPIRTYSSGMYMRLAFSIAINVNADILLIDEILTVGDQYFQQKCFDKLKELKNSGKTIVIVTHSLDIIKQLCNRAIWIYKGSFRLDGDPTYVIQEYINQVNIDHNVDSNKKIDTTETQIIKGVVYIDEPHTFAQIGKNQKILQCRGWEISNIENAKLKISLDNILIEDSQITRTNRIDVYNAYHDSYSNISEFSNLGWQFVIPLEHLSSKTHILSVYNIDEKGDIISKRNVEFNII